MAFELVLYVQPGARRTEIAGRHGAYLKIRLQAPPVEGKANQALIEFIADRLKIKSTAIRLIRGEKSRIKTLEIDAPDLCIGQLEAHLSK